MGRLEDLKAEYRRLYRELQPEYSRLTRRMSALQERQRALQSAQEEYLAAKRAYDARTERLEEIRTEARLLQGKPTPSKPVGSVAPFYAEAQAKSPYRSRP